jgi:hypothetical protein
MMVDYTDFEDLKILREKRKNVCFPITSPAAHHRGGEKKYYEKF